MSDQSREERRSALDEFANLKTDSGGGMVPAMQGAQQTNLVFGAQAVAVHRDEAHVLQKIKVLAAAAGTDWYYRFPVKDKGKTSWIEGPSIKLANDVARLYGNAEVDCRAQDLGSAIMFHARFVDLETGYALTRPFQQRKGASRLGGADEGRRDDITFQIGASKAIRNVVVNALQTFCDFAFVEAKEALVDKIGKDIERWKRVTSERIGARVDLKRVEAVVGRTADNWLAPDIARVIAMGKAVDDGMATWDETFPPLGGSPETTTNQDEKINTRLDDVAADTENTNVAGGPSAASDQTAASEPAPPSSSPEAAVDFDYSTLREAIVGELLGVTARHGSKQDRLDRLEPVTADLVENYPEQESFIREVAVTAVKVIKGELKADAARVYLLGDTTKED